MHSLHVARQGQIRFPAVTMGAEAKGAITLGVSMWCVPSGMVGKLNLIEVAFSPPPLCPAHRRGDTLPVSSFRPFDPCHRACACIRPPCPCLRASFLPLLVWATWLLNDDSIRQEGADYRPDAASVDAIVRKYLAMRDVGLCGLHTHLGRRPRCNPTAAICVSMSGNT